MHYFFGACLAAATLTGCQDDEMGAGQNTSQTALTEADGLITTAAQQTGVSKEAFAGNLVAARFTAEQNVFLPSALAIDYQQKTVTLPLYQGIGPAGGPTYYILTDASDFDVAKLMGLNFAPKLVHGRGSAGSQAVTLENGMIKFKGDVDFSAERSVAAGPFPMTFPPAMAQPGATGDAQYSPLIVLPSGSVLNASIVANATGVHDHLKSVDYAKGTVVFDLLDGFQGGQQFYYHIVTESNDMGAAAIERATYTPRLANLPTFGKSLPTDQSVLLAFSPVANGETGATNPQRQGLNSTILDGIAFDPINVFPLDPENNKRENNNYSPMWDAHINAWTEQAIQAGKRRQIKSFEELQQLVTEGSVINFAGNMGEANSFVAGLKPTKAIINCSVMAQPTNP